MILNNLLKKLPDSYQGFIILCVFNWKFNSTVHQTVNWKLATTSQMIDIFTV